MTKFYDARGNIYGVISPRQVRDHGIALPQSAAQAAQTRESWATAAVHAFCAWAPGEAPPDAKAHRSDGLLIGPFQNEPPFDLLIVNTDGTLAERSGNGLTIFSQALQEQGLMAGTGDCLLQVHHDKPDGLSPLQTSVRAAEFEGAQGFWLDLGKPLFGPGAVGAQDVERVMFNQCDVSRVAALDRLNPAWGNSQFVNIGNPHCVTLVDSAEALPSNSQMRAPALCQSLTRIAYAPPGGSGMPCPMGVNLQWAWLEAEGRIAARVFERGEGPTASSGTSASAVASAAWRVGWVQAGAVSVMMPGGTAPILLEEEAGELARVRLFGTARSVP
ncbi:MULTISPECIES: diaminopimelate epimerase [unclassified Pseudomonas]|uniref:diaminopimelate epimerase n=1 Tax=unclassified Pseudomonas TaxID=196821 RepID=UPI0008768A6C|nr:MULTISPECIES: diaminopimelate epimerase [unclassified Pseudomonas]SCZ43615.1 diaminopimelate epimerase [Pseudomonas sp. NFACC44-2]SDA86230.1 diaminopimelate epimerase [Pseudomonas sp. NFACC51]SDW99214.1 diaminopimelate epimerase [Pseudomonas sp. NFACC08-1]SEI81878.1 diaminopimelate epimerase [Pseudomonas sp. NFACC07-1]SFI52109.1 diaminopimelate epimerase [Pseudomonas sp. NFACC54]